jgi:UDP-N-acetylmuramoyl-tripeptide--D-alanyl-D-alanine ligase
MKKLGRLLVVLVLESQVRRLRRKNDFKVVAVAGSVGKTSTKAAIARVLGQAKRVCYQDGNYNDRVTVPLIFFGRTEPSIMNVFAWLLIFIKNERVLSRPYPYDVVVVELGTDAPGQMQHFAYLKPDISVLTAIAAEHMEKFVTLDAVAAEELAVFDYSEKVLINASNVDAKYTPGRTFVAYGTDDTKAYYRLVHHAQINLQGQTIELRIGDEELNATIALMGEPGAKAALAASAVADMLFIEKPVVIAGLEKLHPFPGRMQILAGVSGSTLIDDTYNASPVAVKAGLDLIYGTSADQRIAILGSMNELGDYTEAAHQEVGAYCDPTKLALVVTIGVSANQWLAPAAEKQGCVVKSFVNPAEAGVFVASQIKNNAIILCKGSQNGVFAEEALKPLLQNPADSAKLVRQSAYWLKIKGQSFSGNE